MQAKRVSMLLLAGALAGPNLASTVIAAEPAASVENRLRQLEDREQIRALIIGYGRTLDRRDFTTFAGLFAAQGGQWVGGFGTATGRAEIRKMMEERIGTGAGGSNFHVFTNESITLDGDRAAGLTKWLFVTQGADNRPALVYLGHYDDTFVREPDGWKIQRRVVYGDIPSQDPLAAATQDGRGIVEKP